MVISGVYLNNITACRFSLSNQYYIVPSTYTNSEIICSSPTLSINGIYRLDLNYKNENWIVTKYKFNFYLSPTFFNTVKLSVVQGITDFDIYGEVFPKGGVYCKATFLKSSIILSGKWLSSSHVVCLKVIYFTLIFT